MTASLPAAPRSRLAARREAPVLAFVAAASALAAAVTLGRPLELLAVVASFVLAYIGLRQPVLVAATLAVVASTNASSALTGSYNIPSLTDALLPAGVIAIAARRWRTSVSLTQPSPGLVLALATYAAVQTTSVMWAADRGAAMAGATDTIRDMVIALVIVAAIRSARDLRTILAALVAAGLALGALALLQVARGEYSSSYGGFARASIEQIVGAVDGWRIKGPFDDPNFFAQAMVIFFGLALGTVLVRRRTDAWRLVALAATAVSGLTVFFTYSRGGMVGLVAVLAVAAVLRPPTPRFATIVAGAAIGLVFLAPTSYRGRVAESVRSLPVIGTGDRITDSAVRGRTSEAIVGVKMFRDYPLGGVGVANYPVHYRDYSRTVGLDPRREDRKPHSFVLEIASETGLVGLASFAAILAGTWSSLRRALKNPPTAAIATTLVLGWTGFLATSIVLHLDYARTLWILVAASFAVGDLARPTPHTRVGPRPHTVTS